MESYPPDVYPLSGLSTLFALWSISWCCIRPDFLSQHASKFRLLGVKLNIVFWCIICPEAVFFWAMRQWFEAGKVAKKFQCHGWTRRHGLVVLMGGFVLCNRQGKPTTVLSFPHLDRLLREKVIDLPHLTSLEIEEQSNFHPAFGIVAFLQTAWLIIKCLSRIINANHLGLGLPSPFETTMFTLVMANWCIYFFTWQKPLDVRLPILIKPIRHNPGQPQPRSLTVEEVFELEQNFRGSQITERRALLDYPDSRPITALRLRFQRRTFIYGLLWPIRSIYHDVRYLLPPHRIDEPAEFSDGTLEVPLFHVQNTMPQIVFLIPATFLSTGVSIVSFLFVICPSWLHTPDGAGAQRVWRVASTTTTLCSVLSLSFAILTNVLYFIFLRLHRGRIRKFVEWLLGLFFLLLIFTLVVGCIPFLLGRGVLLVTSFLYLRAIPSYVSWSWADYIPHLA